MICPVCHSDKDVVKIVFGSCNSHAEGSDGSFSSSESNDYMCNACMGFITHTVNIVDGKITKLVLKYDTTPPTRSNTYA